MATKKISRHSKFIVGASVAAAAAAGVIAFLTQTKKGQELAKRGQKQMTELGQKVAQKCENLKDISKAKYEGLVDEVVQEYQRKKKMTQTVAAELAKELKKEWVRVKQELKK